LSIKEPLVAFPSICAGIPKKKRKKKKGKKRALVAIFLENFQNQTNLGPVQKA
jgi:hypothetical protein